MQETDIELFKEVFRLALGIEKVDSNYSFGEVKHLPECRYVQIECFNRKIPSDFYKVSIMNNNNDVFLEADIFSGPDGYAGYLDQPIWNQALIQKLISTYKAQIGYRE